MRNPYSIHWLTNLPMHSLVNYPNKSSLQTESSDIHESTLIKNGLFCYFHSGQ